MKENIASNKPEIKNQEPLQEEFARYIQSANFYQAVNLYKKNPELQSFIESKEIQKSLGQDLERYIEYGNQGNASSLIENFPLNPRTLEDAFRKSVTSLLKNGNDRYDLKAFIKLCKIDKETFTSIIESIKDEEWIKKPSQKKVDALFSDKE